LKILIIQVGNYTNREKLDESDSYYLFPTILHGEQYFDQKQVINNVQTRESIEHSEHQVEYLFHTDRKRFIDLIKSSFQLRKYTNRYRPDITHIYWGGVSGLLAALFVKGKVVISLLGSDLYGSYDINGKKKLSSKLQTISSRITSFYANGVIVMSSRMKDYLWNRNSRKILILPEGVSFEKFYLMERNTALSKLKWSKDKFYVIFFYEGQNVKNYKLAQESFNKFNIIVPNSELKIIKGLQTRRTGKRL
jgi:hypothetical protein